jgi:hypothetical protein
MEGEATASSATAAHSIAEKHLKDVIWVHPVHATATLLYLLDVLAIVVALPLLRV